MSYEKILIIILAFFMLVSCTNKNENVAAQVLASKNRELYYHTWEKENSTHYYKIDFMISQGTKLDIIEIKSSTLGKHESINEFSRKFSQYINNKYIFSPKDYEKQNDIICIPMYFIPLI